MFSPQSRRLREPILGAMLATFLAAAGCGDPQTGTFSGSNSEKVAAEKNLKPGAGAKQNAPAPPKSTKSRPRQPTSSLPKAE